MFPLKNIITITEARKRLFEISDEVQKSGTIYIITVKGKPSMVLMSAKEFEKLQKKLIPKKRK